MKSAKSATVFPMFTLLGVMLFLLFFISGLTLAGEGHGHWSAPEKAALENNPVNATPDSIEKGRHLFMKNCTACHGKDAKGKGPASSGLHPAPANLVKMAGHHPDGDLAWKIRTGRGDMPGWEKRLTETEIWHLVNFIQSLGH